MQQQLQDLQPELIQTSEETKKLMVKIEKDTVEAEAKKEVIFNQDFLFVFSYKQVERLRKHLLFVTGGRCR